MSTKSEASLISLVRFKPLAVPVIARLLGEGKPDEEIIQTSETEAVSPLVLLPGMNDRISGTDEHSVISDHLNAATATSVHMLPSFAVSTVTRSCGRMALRPGASMSAMATRECKVNSMGQSWNYWWFAIAIIMFHGVILGIG